MKKSIILIITLTFTINSYGQINHPLCQVPDSIVTRYRTSADRLALKQIIKEDPTYQDSIEIPRRYREIFLNALLAVYNARTIPERDTVVDIYKISALGQTNVSYINLTADSTLPWVREIVENRPLSNKPLDSLLKKYNATLIKIYPWKSLSSRNISWLYKTDSNYNMVALHKEFLKVKDILFVDNGVFSIDGNDITGNVYPNYTEISYSFGYGDCPAGCTGRKYWTFRVNNNCEVSFLGNTVTGIKHENLPDEIVAFPNPFRDFIMVGTENSPYSAYLFNNTGNIVAEKEAGKVEFNDLTHLPAGLYILEIRNGNSVIRKKLNKE